MRPWDVFQSCLWQRKQAFKTKTGSFPDPNQQVFEPKPTSQQEIEPKEM